MRQILAVVTLCVGLVGPVWASDDVPPIPVIQLTAGIVDFPRGGIFISGPNFSYTQYHVFQFLNDPLESLCATRTCNPGTTISLGFGLDFVDTHYAIYNGTLYPTGLGTLGTARFRGGFQGSLTLPPITEGAIALQVPITFDAMFIYPPLAMQASGQLQVTGAGTATMVYTAVDGKWRFDGGTFRLDPPEMSCPSHLVNNALDVSVSTTSFDPTPVPNGPAGVFFIDAAITNTSPQELEGPVKFVVGKLTGNNRLLSATEGDGGVGSKHIVTETLAPGATVQHVLLAVGLATPDPFEFFVDAEACAPGD